MIHSNEYPPNWEQISKIFPKAKEQQAVFCYGDTLHNPFQAKITRDLEIHEGVHSKQQKDDPQKWWNKYCSEPEFRVKQEVEAYSAQVYYLKTTNLPSRVIEWYIEKIAQTLSGKLYDECITYHKAKTAVRKSLQSWQGK